MEYQYEYELGHVISRLLYGEATMNNIPSKLWSKMLKNVKIIIDNLDKQKAWKRRRTPKNIPISE